MSLRVAYARGKGPGEKLANVFERAMLRLSAFYATSIELHASSRIFQSDVPFPKEYGDPNDIEHGNLQDALHYEDFLKEQAAHGTRVVFQTSIDAQTLRLVGHHLHAVSVECYDREPHSVLLVRDHSQASSSTSERKAPSICR